MKGGFTLIELMIVISIVSFLSSSIFPSVNASRAKARDTQRISDARAIITALELYRQSHGNFPCVDNTNSTESNFLSVLINEGLLGKTPRDPVNTSGVYVYGYSSFKAVPGGPCGQYFELYYDREQEGTLCIFNGRYVPNSSSSHCHIMYPSPLPCSDPYLALPSVPDDCEILYDT